MRPASRVRMQARVRAPNTRQSQDFKPASAENGLSSLGARASISGLPEIERHETRKSSRPGLRAQASKDDGPTSNHARVPE